MRPDNSKESFLRTPARSEMDSIAHFSHNGNGNGNGYDKISTPSHRTRVANGKPSHKAGAVAAATWEDCTGGSETITSNGSSGISTPSMDAEYADAESQKSLSSRSSVDPSQLPLEVHAMEALISSFFLTVSSLKNAYMQLQSAHAPYDAEKLQLADKAMIAELKKLSELKQSYRKRLAIISSGHVQEEESEAHAEVESKEKVQTFSEGNTNNFHSEIQMKDVAMESLKDILAQTTLKKEKLERRVKRLEQRLARDTLLNFPKNDVSPTPQLLESAVLGASEASRAFSKLLISLMKTAQWDLDAAANSIEPGISFMRRTHKKFVFESYVSHRMLNGFESENFHMNGDNHRSTPSADHSRQQCFKEFQELRTVDPAEAVFGKPESLFAKYCLKKFLDLVHPKMEESFFGNTEHRKQVLTGTHPRSQFYLSFLKLARAMWVLHELAFSFEPNARVFQVKRDTNFSPLYMESIVQMVEIDVSSPGVRPKVGFTVMPGFRVENTIIKCQVYITAPRLDEPVQV